MNFEKTTLIATRQKDGSIEIKAENGKLISTVHAQTGAAEMFFMIMQATLKEKGIEIIFAQNDN